MCLKDAIKQLITNILVVFDIIKKFDFISFKIIDNLEKSIELLHSNSIYIIKFNSFSILKKIQNI
jgi:hypothetical protein